MQKALAEFLGTMFLLSAVVGSGIMAENLTDNQALQLMTNAFATVLMLYVVISIFGNLSGAHLNPIVSLYFFLKKKLATTDLFLFISAQVLGAVAGTLISNFMFGNSLWQISSKERFSNGTFLGEVIATFGLLMIVSTNSSKAAHLVPAWIGAAYFFTSSTSFANPAVTIGRIFTDSFSGIAPNSVLPFIAAQFVGFLALFLIRTKVFKENS